MSAFKMPKWMEEHTKLYQEDPEKAHLWDSSLGTGRATGMIPTLLLTTKGRKSGKTLLTPLIYSKQDGGFAIVASKGGSPDHPAWYLNLEADPDVEIQVGPRHYRAHARTVVSAERKKIWTEMAKLFPLYDEYQGHAGREIPVVLLEPKR